MAFETIRYDGRDGRIRVTLARPDQRNALTATMVEELAEAPERARREEARALGLVRTGAPLSGEAAARWGLIWRAVDDAALADEAEALAGRLAAGPTRAFALAKRAIRDAAVNDLDAQLGREADLQREAGHGEDFHAALEARGTGAAPVFTGR
mgnify:CR=1 FL=1